ncbi:MAG: outer rane efflux protein [Verrucomicrobiales bacterium]|nr:outer rane efflux protein [Verrucomicrobiales bacterium]
MNLKLRNLFVALLCAGSSALGAESSGPSPTNAVPLDALVAETLEKNPELKFYEAEIATTKAGRKQAGLWSNPELSSSVGRKTARDRTSGLNGEGVAWSVSVVQPFEWPGRIGLRKAIANRDLELAQLGLERFRKALASRVRDLGYSYFAAKEHAAVAREVADRFKALREVLVQRDPAGISPLLETRVIEATELTMQRKASDADVATQGALLELNQLRGAAPDAQFAVAPARLTFGPAESLQRLLTLARTNNFELRVRAVELAQQGFRLELAKNERFPSISVGPTYTEETALDRERTIGVGISLPLPLWNRNSGNVATAKARQMQAEVSLTVTQREVERKVVEATMTYESKVRQIGNWRSDAIEHFREAAELADRHYRLGAVPVSTYVELQREYLEAVESLLDTQKEALRAAQDIELLTGARLPVRTTQGSNQQP